MIPKEYKPLTVGELIEILKQYNQDATIETVRYAGFSKHILPIVEKIIEYDKDTNKVEIDVTLYGS